MSRDQQVLPNGSVDIVDLPAVTTYQELLAAAVAQLEVEEPGWSTRRREQVAREMVEAYCSGAPSRLRRGPKQICGAVPDLAAGGGAVLGALWANDLRLLDRLGPNSSGYRLAEVLPDRRASRLAAAMAEEDSQVLHRLERGCRAFAAWDWPDEVVGWLWVSTGEESAPPLRRFLRFASDECYGWNAGTRPTHRGHGLFTALLRYAGWQIAQEGCRLMWGGILDSNLASRHSCIAAGFRPVVRVTATHESPPTRLHVRPADYADERLVERALRVLAIPANTTPNEARNGTAAAAALPAGRQA